MKKREGYFRDDGSMINVTLPDGAVRQIDAGTTIHDFAGSISKSLQKAALVGRLDGELVDLSTPLEKDSKVEILTKKEEDTLEVIRHDAAHVLAEAVKELYPEVQITIGPVIDNGFYYDIHREESFTPEDLEKIEKRMAQIVDRNETIAREVWDRDEAVKFFKSIGEDFKAEIISDLPKGEEISLYRQGEFIDLCRGPHLPSTGKLGKAFKLMKLAGAYWRGDSNNVMLQRIYGTAWRDEKELKAYLHMLEEAEKRDHRRLGKEMGLFHFQEEAPGSVFWHDKGWKIYYTIEAYIRRKIGAVGYGEVKTPMLVDRTLWEKSGHWEKFRENMFTSESEERVFALKPMNCPCHVQIFNQGIKSYRDLPLRMAEFGSCHRNEPSGALHGLMRVRAFTQDDAHVFCTEDQIISESKAFCDLLLSVYKDFGFEDVAVKFSDRPEVRAGTDAIWDKAENALKEAVEAADLPYTMNPGEGAFYGPKLEFVLKDSIGREWQCGTLQVDFVMPERLDANYIGEDGNKHRPVMLHRAILGSFERFIGILIENYAGKLPLWLAPTQIVVAPITETFNNYAVEIYEKMREAGLRCETDLRNEKVSYKIREHSHSKTPIILVIGERESNEKTVTIRRLGTKNQETLALSDAIDLFVNEAKMP